MRQLVVLSGQIASGKSDLCAQFGSRFNACILRTREILDIQLLRADPGRDRSRTALQQAGQHLDKETHGAWVVDALRLATAELPADAIVVLDSARTLDQIAALRAAHAGHTWHVHLKAARFLRERRYNARREATFEETSFEQASQDPVEQRVTDLESVADVVISTNAADALSVLAQAVAGLGLHPGAPERLVDVIVGAQYGSEGKGNICAQLAADYQVLMRVGGPNAGHMVADPPYKYVQLPSGTRSEHKPAILIGAGATLWLPQVLKEIADCGLTPERLAIDPQAMIIEPLDREMEEKSLEVIGSTKQGVGAATARKILGRGNGQQFGAPVKLARQVTELKDFVRCTKRELERAYVARHRIMLEGTQGTDLSLHHGPYPHVTSRDTTASGCLADAGIAPNRVRKVIMVTRTYPIRVGGTSGPMMKEIDVQTIAKRSKLLVDKIQKTEIGTVSGKSRRIGEFDWEQLRRAAVLNGATDVALTFVDYLDADNAQATSFDGLSAATKNFVARVDAVANAPVTLLSVGFGSALIERGYQR